MKSSSSLFCLLSTFLFFSTQGNANDKVADWISTEAQWKHLTDGKVILLEKTEGKNGEKSSHGATAAIMVPAPVKEVWGVIDDKESAPDYIDSLVSAKVIEQTSKHSLIEQKVKVGFNKVKYVVKHVPEAPHSVNFSLHSGDVKDIRGFWKFIPVNDGKNTLLIYSLSLKPGFPVPGFVIRDSLEESLPEALVAVKGEVARRS
ncbi:MAG: hypothetical protein HKN23_13685 [Verrucomicrobiales bacterium]|nr:hypothetical protein [Verrucomicrobiales bacterium]